MSAPGWNWTPSGEYMGERGACLEEGHVYVALFAPKLTAGIPADVKTVIKVGMTNEPGRRLRQIHDANTRSLDFTGAWASPPHFGYRETERLALRWCRERLGYPLHCWGEYFENVPPEPVIDFALTLPMVRHADKLGRFGADCACNWDTRQSGKERRRLARQERKAATKQTT